MLSAQARNVSNEYVTAYLYERPLQMVGGTTSILEYYIPSENMSFNKYSADWADKFHNISDSTREVSAVTRL